MKRRDFIKVAAAVSVAAAMPQPTEDPQVSEMPPHTTLTESQIAYLNRLDCPFTLTPINLEREIEATFYSDDLGSTWSFELRS